MWFSASFNIHDIPVGLSSRWEPGQPGRWCERAVVADGRCGAPRRELGKQDTPVRAECWAHSAIGFPRERHQEKFRGRGEAKSHGTVRVCYILHFLDRFIYVYYMYFWQICTHNTFDKYKMTLVSQTPIYPAPDLEEHISDPLATGTSLTAWRPFLPEIFTRLSFVVTILASLDFSRPTYQSLNSIFLALRHCGPLAMWSYCLRSFRPLPSCLRLHFWDSSMAVNEEPQFIYFHCW